MNKLLLLITSISALVFLAYYQTAVLNSDSIGEQGNELHKLKRLSNQFRKWMVKLSKKYASDEEETYRFAIYMENKKKIEEINQINEQRNRTITLGENSFVDMSHEEFVQTKLGKKQRPLEENYIHPELLKLSQTPKLKAASNEHYDYRYLNRGIGIREQKCGDCWANAASSVSEMSFTRQKVSTQDLINCVQKSSGCDGGDAYFGFQHIIKYGIALDKDVPYKAKDMQCSSSASRVKPPSDTTVVRFSNRIGTPQCDLLKEMVQQYGVINVAMYAEESPEMSFYKDGILDHDLNADWVFDDYGRHQLNHDVTLVGYTKDYWIIQNSWGASWGIDGYVKIKMGDYFNVCHEAAGFSSTQLRFLTESKAPSKVSTSIKYRVANKKCDESKCAQAETTYNRTKQYSTCPNDFGDATIDFDGSYLQTIQNLKVTMDVITDNSDYVEEYIFDSEIGQRDGDYDERYSYVDTKGIYRLINCDTQYTLPNKYQLLCKLKASSSIKKNHLPQRFLLYREDTKSGCGYSVLDQVE